MRVSGSSQLDGEGWSRQLDAINAYARAHDTEVVNVYREEAIPGKTELDGRPAFLSMLADLLANGTRTIIVERLDRLAREYRVQEELLLYLMRHEVTLISADTAEDITAAMNADPMRRFVVQLQGLLAELDKNLTVAKLKKARAAKRAKGGYSGGNRPYGFFPDEGETAERIRQLRAEGHSLTAIRQVITSEGRKPRSGPNSAWQLSTIHKIATAGKNLCADRA